MSKSEDKPDPENIEWRHTESFEPSKYLIRIGRGDETTRQKMSPHEIADLIRQPKAQPFDVILNKWRTEPGLAEEYPHASGVKFRAVINQITPRPCDKIIRNGDSYFSAGKAINMCSKGRASINVFNSSDAPIRRCQSLVLDKS
jgi:hypothetical protein